MAEKGTDFIKFEDKENNLNVDLWKRFLSKNEEEQLYTKILESVKWYRVKYKSRRFRISALPHVGLISMVDTNT